MLATAACSSDDEPGAATCESMVRDAAFATEVAEQLSLIDAAFVECGSVEELTTAMENYPSMIGFDIATFVELRCSSVENTVVLASSTCQEANPPATTVAAVDTELVYVGDTLDGRRIEIRPDADTAFVGDLPASIQETVDIATEAGCAGVIERRDFWAAQISDPATRDEASVYAKHAQNVANFIGCGAAALPAEDG